MNLLGYKLKRFISLLISLVMVLSLIPQISSPAKAEDVIIPKGNSSNGWVKDILFSSFTGNDNIAGINFNPSTTEYEGMIVDVLMQAKLQLTVAKLPESGSLYWTVLKDGQTKIISNSSIATSEPTSINLGSGNILNNIPIGTTAIFSVLVGPEQYDDTKNVSSYTGDVYNFKITRKPGLSALTLTDTDGKSISLSPRYVAATGGWRDEFEATVTSGHKIKLTANARNAVTYCLGDSSEKFTTGFAGYEIDLIDYCEDGSTSAIIPIHLIYDNGTYYAENTITLKIWMTNYAPVITQQPTGVSGAKGAVPALSIAATTASEADANSLTYQWYMGGAVEGATGMTFIPPSNRAGVFSCWCVVSNTAEGKTFSTESERVSVRVNLSEVNSPQIIYEPDSFDTLKTEYTNGQKFEGFTVYTDYPESGVTYSLAFFHNTEPTTEGAEQIEVRLEDGSSDGSTYVEQRWSSAVSFETGTHYVWCVVTATADDTTPGLEPASTRTKMVELTYEPSSISGLDGSGTKADPYLIKTADDFVTIRELVNSGTTWLSGLQFKMTADIDLPADWEPIGRDEARDEYSNDVEAFGGALDGDGHTLTVPKGGKPLLNYVSDAVIKNLNIKGEQIDGCGLIDKSFVDYGEDGNYSTGCPPAVTLENVTLKRGSSTRKSGFMEGSGSGANTITIRNCTVESGVVIGYEKTQYGIGSFVGGSFNGIIDSSYSYATVYGVSNVGGLAGKKGQSMGACTIHNSGFIGNIVATGDWVGGIIAQGYTEESAPNTPPVSFINCYVSADITGRDYIGGVFGGEGGLKNAWNVATLQDSIFHGTITATGSGDHVGGIIGHYNSVNTNAQMRNNYFYEDSGKVTKVIGSVGFYVMATGTVDPSDPDGRYKVDAGNGFADEDALNAWITNSGSLKTAEEFAGSHVLDLLNSGSYQNWVQGGKHPVHSSDAVLTDLEVIGEPKQHQIGEDFDPTGLTFTAVWSDGRTEAVPVSAIEFTGYDSTKHGLQTVTATYGSAKAELQVTVLRPAGTITVQFALLGDYNHEATSSNTHTLAHGGLARWIPSGGSDIYVTYDVDANATVKDVVEKAVGTSNISNPSGNYIESITWNGITLAEKGNGELSGWMYTINDVHSNLGVAEQYLNDGDKIIFHYTDDYTQETSIGTIVPDVPGPSVDTSTYGSALTSVLARVAAQTPSPRVGAIGGEWAVVALARGGAMTSAISNNYLENLYYYAQTRGGQLDTTGGQYSHTEYSRVILALTALGLDATSYETWNFVTPLFDNGCTQVSAQGNNGTAFALIALDSGNYYDNAQGNEARRIWINQLASTQTTAGSWSISGSNAQSFDLDTTAMVVQALAPYCTGKRALPSGVSSASLRSMVDRAVSFLSGQQNSTGGFGSSEADAQIVVMLSALERDAATDSAFVKGGRSVLEDLLGYRVSSTGGFSHVRTSGENQMATEQAAYALVAYDRYKHSRNSLYNMTDATSTGADYTVTATVVGGHGSVTPSSVSVRRGGTASFTITPDAGYQVADVKVDGQSAWAGFSLRSMDLDEYLPIETCAHILHYVEAEPAICSTPGVREYWVCELCENVFLDALGWNPVEAYEELETEIDPANHPEDGRTLVNVKAATCVEAGHTGDVVCDYCHQVLTPGAVISALGHQFGEDDVCTVCGTVNGAEAPAVPAPDEEATGSEAGTTAPEEEIITETAESTFFSGYDYGYGDYYGPDYEKTGSTTFTLSRVTANHRVEVTFEPVKATPVISVSSTGGTASVPEAEIQKAIQAVTQTGGQGTITIAPSQSTGSAPVSVELPTASAAAIGAQTNAELMVRTDNGVVTLDNAAVASAASQATGTSLQIVTATKSVSQVQSQVAEELSPGSAVVEVSVLSNGQKITSFSGTITVFIPVNSNFTAGLSYPVIILSDNGGVERTTGRCMVGSDGKQYVKVTVNHLSTFIVPNVVIDHIVSVSAGANGKITPSGDITVADGGSYTFDIQADEGYEIKELVLIDAQGTRKTIEPAYLYVEGIPTELTKDSHIKAAQYTLENITEDCRFRVEFKRGIELPDYGPVIGQVTISVENNTYSGGDFTGTLLSGTYDLCQRDTMMTSVLKALTLNGYTWSDSSGKDDYDITYIAHISKDGKSLGEFSGTANSGWMGTLNDWFTNEGFQAFKVGGYGSYALEDGDEIKIQYTQDLGADIGGGWGNPDTSLKALTISGGTLVPKFKSDALEYTLMVPDSGLSVKVTPTAANKTFMVKTFLNTYNSESAYYKRTREISVKPGDTLYIGVGEPGWATMYDSGAYTPTKYTIQVISNDIQARIDALPKPEDITYENYKGYVELVEQLRKDYDKLTDEKKEAIDATKLIEVEKRIKLFKEIDEVKKLLDAIPEAKNLKKSNAKKIQEQVKAAYDAYQKLTDEQKAYIMKGDVVKHNAAVEWLEKNGYKTDGPILIGTDGKPVALPFTDVEKHWALEAIQFVYEHNLMNGMSPTTFEPDSEMSRAMFVTVLYRMEGEPTVTGSNTFTDVAAGQWYTDAVAWANANGIVNGMSATTFEPNTNVTREQMAALMYRYAKYKGYDITATADLGSYTDNAQVHDWAYRAMQWANGVGLITGRTETTLVPVGTATRAENATILMRFLQKFEAAKYA